MYTLERANNYIEKNYHQVNTEYRHKYHMMAPIGWINDPNGFIYYKGEYHLFYQYFPYKAVWGPMHWGHAVSKDLVNWKNAPIALAPDQEYDKDGCFSGTAIEKDGKMYLMYTGHIVGETPEKNRQVQCLAVSSDGIVFEKVAQNPILTEKDLPENAKPQDFRDPKVIKKGDFYYSLIASKATDGGGQILLYKSENLLDWEYVSVMLKGTSEEGSMWECPDIFELDGKDVLIISVEGLPQKDNNFVNTHSVLSFIGEMDWNNGVFHKELVEELDYGLDFYAPQTIEDDNNRRIMVSWMQMWGRNIPTETKGHGWAGAMTLPRELKLINNCLQQKPIPEIKKYVSNYQKIESVLLKDEVRKLDELSCEIGILSFEADGTNGEKLTLIFRSNELEKTVLSYDYCTGHLQLDRQKSGVPIIGKETEHQYERTIYMNSKNKQLKVEIYLDKASIEVFVNEGEYTMTSTIYPINTAEKVIVQADGEIRIDNLEKWDIEV